MDSRRDVVRRPLQASCKCLSLNVTHNIYGLGTRHDRVAMGLFSLQSALTDVSHRVSNLLFTADSARRRPWAGRTFGGELSRTDRASPL